MISDSEDFYYENGLMVFTEKYHLKRGHCCNSGCRHCPYKKRVVSLVPSWTETLLFAGVDVVGRTRFCIHPEDLVKKIPIVGGTKNWTWEKIVEINPDLVLLDKEENPKFMSEQDTFKWHASHVQNISDMPDQIDQLSNLLSNPQLSELSQRWKTVLSAPKKTIQDFTQLPGILEWGIKPTQPIKQVLYLIWKDPWMAVSCDTFIGSVLDLFGLELPQFADKYPKINLDDFNPKETLILFSSEPYPFLKKKDEMGYLTFPYAFVDGESFSWFGLRALEFIEKSIKP
jgi:iron complex transport system substrate-binding protein